MHRIRRERHRIRRSKSPRLLRYASVRRSGEGELRRKSGQGGIDDIITRGERTSSMPDSSSSHIPSSSFIDLLNPPPPPLYSTHLRLGRRDLQRRPSFLFAREILIVALRASKLDWRVKAVLIQREVHGIDSSSKDHANVQNGILRLDHTFVPITWSKNPAARDKSK